MPLLHAYDHPPVSKIIYHDHDDEKRIGPSCPAFRSLDEQITIFLRGHADELSEDLGKIALGRIVQKACNVG